MTELLRSISMFPFKLVVQIRASWQVLWNFNKYIRINDPQQTLVVVKDPVSGGRVLFLPYTTQAPWGKFVDPINIIYWGANAKKLAKEIMAQESGWRRIYKSYQFAYAYGKYSWQISSVQIVKNVPGQLGCGDLRYHVRLFSFVSDSGVPVTLGAAHFEHKKHGHQIISWDAARDEVVRALGFVPDACTYISEVSEQNWREHPNDGRAVFLGATLPEPIEVGIE